MADPRCYWAAEGSSPSTPYWAAEVEMGAAAVAHAQAAEPAAAEQLERAAELFNEAAAAPTARQFQFFHATVTRPLELQTASTRRSGAVGGSGACRLCGHKAVAAAGAHWFRYGPAQGTGSEPHKLCLTCGTAVLRAALREAGCAFPPLGAASAGAARAGSAERAQQHRRPAASGGSSADEQAQSGSSGSEAMSEEEEQESAGGSGSDDGAEAGGAAAPAGPADTTTMPEVGNRIEVWLSVPQKGSHSQATRFVGTVASVCGPRSVTLRDVANVTGFERAGGKPYPTVAAKAAALSRGEAVQLTECAEKGRRTGNFRVVP